MTDAPATLSFRWRIGNGIDGLIIFLRQHGFRVSASEAIDAARLISHLAINDAQADSRDARWLIPKLRPIFCKRPEDQERFESIFLEWAQLGATVEQHVTPMRDVIAGKQAPNQAPAKRTGAWKGLLFIALLALLITLFTLHDKSKPVQNPTAVTQPVEPARVDNSAKITAPISAGEKEKDYGFFPAIRYNWELKPEIAIGLVVTLGTSLLFLAVPLATPWLGHARRSGQRLPLDLSSLREEAKRIVPKLSADIQARLDRHVPGPPEMHARLQRRPPIHVRATIEATLRNLGLLSLRYRTARLRPSYLLLIDVTPESNAHGAVIADPRYRMFYSWAERIKRTGIDVDIRLVRMDTTTQSAVTVQPSGSGWQLAGDDGAPLDRLPDPPVGQRLIVISNGNLLTTPEGVWHDWANRARFHRWAQRAIFTTVEPRDWGDREDELERRERPSDAGFYVLPLDESALDAWSTLIVTGRLPRFTLSHNQGYPKLLRQLELQGETDQLLDPDNPFPQTGKLLEQIRHYLGENGFLWLCACAVPPILRWDLCLLLGEQYYLNAGIKADRLHEYIALDYPRMALMPWLRAQRMPDWFRLALLDSLPRALQDEIRQVVRERLGKIDPEHAGDEAIRLEQPPGPTGRDLLWQDANETDALYLGYLAGKTPRQLMLRAPRQWRDWLGRLPLSQRAGLWRDWLVAWRDRLLWRDGLAFLGPSRSMGAWAATLCAIMLATVVSIAAIPATEIPTNLRLWLYAEQGRGIAFPHLGAVQFAVFSPDGRRIVTASTDNTARVWDAATGAALGPPLQHASKVNHVAFSPDGRCIVTASSDFTARIWDVATGSAIGAPMKHDAPIHHAAFSPNGRRIVTASSDKTAHQWDAATGNAFGPPLRHSSWVIQAMFSPDGRRIVTASADNTARLWDATTGASLGTPLHHDGTVTHAAFSPDGRTIVTASEDKTARLWDTTTGIALGPPLQHASTVTHATFSPDGRLVVTASTDNTARLWNATTGAFRVSLRGHNGEVRQAAFSPDSRTIVTASVDNTARLWDAATGAALGPPMQHDGPVYHAAFGPDGRRIVTASEDKTARVWDAATGGALGPPLQHADLVWHAAFSPDGRRIVTASDDHTARVWDAATGAALGPPLQHADTVRHAAFSPDGRSIVTASWDNTARVWDAAIGAALGPPLQHAGRVFHAAFSPDGRTLVTASWDNTAHVWDAATGAPVGPPLQHTGPVNHAAFSPDGRRIVTTSDDNTARVWDAATGAALGPPLQHADTVDHAAFSPDGRTLVTASWDNTARVWDAATGAPLGPPLQHTGPVSHAAFSPDGRRIVTASSDKTARVWDATTGAPLGPPLQHAGMVSHAAFSPDGRAIVTASNDNTARVWDAATGAPLGPPLQHTGPVNHAAFSPDGRRMVTAWGILDFGQNSPSTVETGKTVPNAAQAVPRTNAPPILPAQKSAPTQLQPRRAPDKAAPPNGNTSGASTDESTTNGRPAAPPAEKGAPPATTAVQRQETSPAEAGFVETTEASSPPEQRTPRPVPRSGPRSSQEGALERIANAIASSVWAQNPPQPPLIPAGGGALIWHATPLPLAWPAPLANREIWTACLAIALASFLIFAAATRWRADRRLLAELTEGRG